LKFYTKDGPLRFFGAGWEHATAEKIAPDEMNEEKTSPIPIFYHAIQKGGEWKMARKANIGFLSTYPPYECSVAEFTKELVHALDGADAFNTSVIAVSDPAMHVHGAKILHHIDREDRDAYILAAHRLNKSDLDLIVIEHDYRIYGGAQGRHILDFMDHLEIPSVVTLHTVPHEPDRIRKQIIQQMALKSGRIVTMSNNSKAILKSSYSVPSRKIAVIQHGVAANSAEDRDALKKRFGFEGRAVLVSHGFLDPGNGLEYSIEAVAKLLHQNHDLVYLILGHAHSDPAGESYRRKLTNLVSLLDLENSVQFIDSHLTSEEIGMYIKMSDICLTTDLSQDHAVSGTLAQAIGCGRAVISTPYPYAEEMLADGRGMLADFEDAASIARCVNHLIQNPDEKAFMEERALALGESMLWDKIALQYSKLFGTVLSSQKAYLKAI